MKLVKLSLATTLVAGALATSSFATPLEEVIKDVDLSGYSYVRYDIMPNDDDFTTRWRFRTDLTLKSTIDDNFFWVTTIRFDANRDRGSASKDAKASIYANNPDLTLSEAYLGYNVGNSTFLLGRQTVGAFWTDDMYANGIKFVNTDIEGLTLAALAMDALEADSDIGSLTHTTEITNTSGSTTTVTDVNTVAHFTGKAVNQHNLYGVAAIGSYDPVSFQLWYAHLQDVTHLAAAQLGFDIPLAEEVKLPVVLQYSRTDFVSKFKKPFGGLVADSNFFGAQVGASVYGFDINAGYVNYGKKDAISLSSFEDQGALIGAGEELLDYSFYEGKWQAIFGTLNIPIADSGVSIGGDVVYAKNKVGEDKADALETVLRLGYKYSEKLAFTGWWSHIDYDGDATSDKIRLQAKYSF